MPTPYFYSTEKINFEVDIVKWILEKSKKELSVSKSNVGGCKVSYSLTKQS